MGSTLLWAILSGVILVASYFVLPWLLKRIVRKGMQRCVSASGAVIITFDDGPDPDATPRILDILSLHGVKAAFFVVGEKAAMWPDLVRRIVSEGHAVGEHGYAHAHAWTSLPHVYLRDLLKGRRAIEVIVGRQFRGFMRPAYGKLNILTIIYCWLGQRRLVFWTVDPKDYQAASAEEVSTCTIGRIRSMGGGVVLLHDGRRRAEHNSVEITVNAVREICALIAAGSLRSGTLGEVMRKASRPSARSKCTG